MAVSSDDNDGGQRLATLEANVAAMNGLQGYDVVIVCCSGEKQADYWQARLTAVRCVCACMCEVLFPQCSKDGSTRRKDNVCLWLSPPPPLTFFIHTTVTHRGQMLPAECKVLAVFEDWAGDGAGNGAYADACI